MIQAGQHFIKVRRLIQMVGYLRMTGPFRQELLVYVFYVSVLVVVAVTQMD
jgi:hypothetical protein